MAEASTASLRDHSNIIELLELLKSPGFQSQQKEYETLLESAEAVIKQYGSILMELDALNDKINKITDRKNPLHRMAANLEKYAADIGKQLNNVKENILTFTGNALHAAKEKGLSALGSAFAFFNVRENLQAMSRGLAKSVESLDKAVSRVAQLEEHNRQKTGTREYAQAVLLAESIQPAEMPHAAVKAQDAGLVELLADTRLDFENLPPAELNAAYGKLLAIGMDPDNGLTVNELACLHGLTGEAESLLPDHGGSKLMDDIENENNQGEEIG